MYRCAPIAYSSYRRKEALRSHKPVGILHELADFGPVGIPVQPDADPPTRPNVWRHEESVRVGLDHQRLIPGPGLAPDGWPSRPVVVLGVRVHGEQLVTDAERRLTPVSYTHLRATRLLSISY